MKTFRITFTTTCPACQASATYKYRGLGESHVNLLKSMGSTYTNWKCDHCQNTVDAELRGVTTEEEGKKCSP